MKAVHTLEMRNAIENWLMTWVGDVAERQARKLIYCGDAAVSLWRPVGNRDIMDSGFADSNFDEWAVGNQQMSAVQHGVLLIVRTLPPCS
jgi:hypothetical protein